MNALCLEVRTDNPDKRHIKKIADTLRSGGIAILPTDSIYAFVCDPAKKNSIERMCKLMNKKTHQAKLSLICTDLSEISKYARQLSNPVFKLMKRLLPGPYTFILEANSTVSKMFKTKKPTIGIRVPDHSIIQEVLLEMGTPLVSSSIHSTDEIQTYLTEADEIIEAWSDKVELIVDGGAGSNVGTTVIDCTTMEPSVIREGLGVEAVN